MANYSDIFEEFGVTTHTVTKPTKDIKKVKRVKLSPEQKYEIALYKRHKKLEKYVLGLAKTYFGNIYKEKRNLVIQKYKGGGLSPKQLMSRSHDSKFNGVNKDELLIGGNVNTREELITHLDFNDVSYLLEKWDIEAESKVPESKILLNPPVSNEVNSNEKSNEAFELLKKLTKSNKGNKHMFSKIKI